MPPISPELESLLVTRDSLQASIAEREKIQETQSEGFRRVTDQERARLRDIETRIAELSPAPKGGKTNPQA